MEFCHNNEMLSFDDVLLIPSYSNIGSRLDTDITSKFSPNIPIAFPFVSTNMSTVTEHRMMVAMQSMGSIGLLHRFMDIEHMFKNIDALLYRHKDAPVVPSLGIKDQDTAVRLLERYPNNIKAFLVDVAHGHCEGVRSLVLWLKDNFKGIDVVAGNVATDTGAKFLLDAGADGIRVGIGGGGVCTTRTVTGFGVPTLQSVIWVSSLKEKYTFTLIADGGFRFSGDIAKALAFGADCVSLGTMLAGTDDSPGEVRGNVCEPLHKVMYGMSSKTAQELLRDGVRDGIASEGMTRKIPYIGATCDVAKEIAGGIRSSLTYCGARNLHEFRHNAICRRISIGAARESKLR